MKCLLRVRWVALMLGLILSVGGCESKILSSKPESAKSSSNAPTDDKSSIEAEPTEEVSIPSNVAGSYLVCRPLEAYQVEAAAVGCRMSQLPDGSKDQTIRSDDLQWKILNAGTSPMDAQIHRQVQNSDWHVTVSIRAATVDEWAQKLKDYRINVRNPDNEQIADESLQKAIDRDKLIHSSDRPLTDPRLEQVPTGLLLSWQAAPTANVLIVRWNDASPLTQAPQNKAIYSVGNTLGNGEVVFNGSASSWIDQTAATGSTYSYQLWVYNAQSLTYNNPEQLHLVRSCGELKARFPQVTTRDHVMDADGYGNQPSFRAFCDMDFDGGGWTLILNYAHARSTNPPLAVKTQNLPLLGSSQLGMDESSMSWLWGHAAPQLINTLSFSTARFWCTSDHKRVMHFRTNSLPCMTYMRSGVGTCADLPNSISNYPDHTATMVMTNFSANSGSETLTLEPFYQAQISHWNIHADFGTNNNDRWECDVPMDTQQTQNTLHRVWVR